MADGINYDENSGEQIAIIGMTGRFPGAKNIDEFWQNLHDGVESITFFGADELAQSGLDPSLLNNPRYVGADGVIEDMDMFDAEFFNIPPREAELMDPQHRLFLECAWELMEQAGYDSESYPGRVAVYGSANLSTYLMRNVMSNPEMRATTSSFQTMITNDKDFVATRVSYKMNLTGPSLSVATLCSSGAVAIHLGCQALLNYQADMALAGAVSLQVSREDAFFYQEGGIGDPDGHCRAFDAKASGTVSGSGVALVALKRLEDALKDGDYICAILRSTAINNDGAIKYSYTAPSVEGQAEVIAEAIALAGVDPQTITYVETHGTGTHLGDPIEVTALTQAFRGNGAQGNQFCAIGSVKTNIGHLVNAGGVASLIKTVLAMQHGQIPASLNFDQPNPQIDFEHSPFYVATRCTDWNPTGFPRRAGVSSFGIGGTNVHMIVEQAPPLEPSGKSRARQLITLSARTAAALEKQAGNLSTYLQAHPEADLADVAFTLQVGRRAFPHRRVLLCSDIQDTLRALSAGDPVRVRTQFQQSKNRPVAFLFPGAGEKLSSRARELYEGEPTFREQVVTGTGIARPFLKLDLLEILYPEPSAIERAEELLRQPAAAQGALLVWEYALAKLWQEWGVEPQGVVGEGVGELTAACLSGALSLEAALGLVAGVRPVERGDLQSPGIPWISGVTKKWITEKEAMDPAYWNRLLSQATSFSEQVKILLLETEQVLLEVGPGHTLNTLLGSHPAKTERQVLLASLGASDGQTPGGVILSTLGELWLAGVRVDWYGFHTHEKRRRLPLPTYPFERKRYWVEPALDASAGSGQRPVQALNTKKADIADWFYIPSWKRSLLPRGNARTAPSTWLIFADEAAGPGRQLAAQLAQAGQDVTVVAPGKAFSRKADGTYRLRPGQKQDYDALFEQLLEQGRAPRDILYAWSVTGGKSVDPNDDTGFPGLLSLAQSLGQYAPAERIHLTILSNGLHEVSEDHPLHAEKSRLLGAMKVIAQENTALVCRNIDLVWPGPAGSREKLVGRLYTELTARPRDAVVAYRGAHRWVQAYEPVRLEKPANSAWLQRNSSYLIVGSADGIALALAKHLAGNFAARVAFVCKQAESFLAGQESQMVIEADIADEGQLTAALTQAEAAFGRLNGVIYAADDFGRPAFHSTGEIGREDYESRFRAHRDELQALAQALAERELDFCLVNSSLSSVLGGLGLAVYAAAYSYVDAFVRLQNRTSRTPWVSVNWDAWKMAGSPTSLLGNRMDALSIAPEEGTDAFERILASGEGGQIILSTMDLQARLGQWVADATDAAQPQSKKAITLHPRPDLATPYVPPRNEVEQKIAAIWQALLGLETVGVHDNFFELGGHSLMAVQVISRVREAFGMDLPLTNLFEQPTIAFLADYIAAVRWALQEQTGSQKEGRQEIEL